MKNNILNKIRLKITALALVLAYTLQPVASYAEGVELTGPADDLRNSQIQLLSQQYQISPQRIAELFEQYANDEKQGRKTVRVLSLDGGGIRGVGTLALLGTLEMKTGKKVHELFDRIYGTSTGGLMGVLFAFGYSATDVLNIYMDGASRIFKRSWYQSVTNPFGLIWAAYDPSGLEGLIDELLPGRLLKEARLPVAVTTIDESTRKPVLLSSEDEETRNVRVLEAGRATSAAPTYFPQMLVHTKSREFMGSDGGTLVNNPAMEAYLHTQIVFKGEKIRINLLSLGTGEEKASSLDANTGKLGMLPKVTKVLMDPHAALVDHTLTQFAAMSNDVLPTLLDYTRVQFNLPHAIDLAAIDEATKNKLLKLAIIETESDKFKQLIRELNLGRKFAQN